MGKTLSAFLIGGAIGAAAVYFTSPRSGFENRNLAKDAVSAVLPTGSEEGGSVASQASETVRAAAEKGQEALKTAAEKGQEFYTTAVAKVQGAVGGAPAGDTAATSENDELRQKIEAARARIAEQVMKNAEDAQLVDTDATVVEEAEATVVEAVEEAVQYTTAEAAPAEAAE